MLATAFKEWAAVCRALADGRQALILRKGGIAEAGGEFRPEFPRFWLYPTHYHEQQQKGLKPEFVSLIDAAERPPAGRVRLGHFVEAAAAHFVTDVDKAVSLDGLHVRSADSVRQRFHYRTPGLFVLPVRVYRVVAPVEVDEHPAYAGCKTWVNLEAPAEELPAEPVLTDEQWNDQLTRLATLLG